MTQSLSMTAWQRIDVRVDELIVKRFNASARDLALADALRVIAAASRAGATIQQALLRASQRADNGVSRACGQAAARIALGHPIELAMDNLATSIDTPAARLLATIVRVQHRSGGDLGSPCHRLASMLHDRIQLDAEARSATAQARFSARAVLAIPIILAVVAWWRAPETVEAMLQPRSLILALPGVLLIVLGALVVRRTAHGALRLGRVQAPRSSLQIKGLRHIMIKAAGGGPLSAQSARLGTAVCVLSIPFIALSPRPLMLLCVLVAVCCAALWPWSERARIRHFHRVIVQSGIESLLEVSIALLSAGATVHEVATIAPSSCEDPLRSSLGPAVSLVGLGRTIDSAFGDLPEVAVSAQLDGWLHALCTTAELGSPSILVLEQLLRDARMQRREQLRQVAQTAAPRMQLALVLLVVPGIMWLMLLATVGGLVRQLSVSGVL